MLQDLKVTNLIPIREAWNSARNSKIQAAVFFESLIQLIVAISLAEDMH
jgi:hypothetical protein